MWNVRLLLVLFVFQVLPISAQNGWRMSGYNGSRTNGSSAIGPVQPTFQQLIVNAPGNLSRIAKDGSLVLYDGNALTSYSAGGALKWTTVVGAISDLALTPSGTIYTSTPTSVSAWNPANGQPAWPNPYPITTNNTETSALAVSQDGTVFIVTGTLVTAINENGTLKWQRTLTFRGYEQLVLSTDESLGYILDLTDTWIGTEVLEHAVSTATGQDVYAITSYQQIRGNTYAFAPWSIIYTGGFSGPLVGCTSNFSSCTNINTSGIYSGFVTLTTSGLIVAPSTNGGYTVLGQTGSIVWTSAERLAGGFSDANGILFAIAPDTNDIVSVDPSSGHEIWRQHFAATPGSLLLGDDGCLYANIGTGLYKGCAAPQTGTIYVSSTPPGAFFQLKGPGTTFYSGNAPQTIPLAPAGDYTITWSTLLGGYITPPQQTQTLLAGSSITFAGF